MRAMPTSTKDGAYRGSAAFWHVEKEEDDRVRVEVGRVNQAGTEVPRRPAEAHDDETCRVASLPGHFQLS